jgi:NhaP-type Na+/H+ or K+/H+ antiporter
MSLIALFVTLVFAHSLVSARLERSLLTAPMLFAATGMLAGLLLPEAVRQPFGRGLFLQVAELGLVLLLFTDAARTDLGLLRHIRRLPVRLLSVGMLLTMLLGAVAARLVFPSLTVWEAGILAAILAPTDAGLGQVIVNSPRVPSTVRQALNVEAGLNDGLSVPFLLFFAALAASGAAGEGAPLGRFVWEQLGIGTAIGAGVGLAGGALLGWAHRHGWMAHAWRQIGVVILPLVCVMASEHLGASMFIAAFVAGMAVQPGFRDAGTLGVEFAEEWGQLLNLSVFFLFGVLVAGAHAQFDAVHLLYAVLSLTVVRMLPVALALIGTRLSGGTVLFMGWFGPRGLASIVLGLVYLEHEAHTGGESTIRLAVMATVLLSIFAHGLSATPGMARYAAHVNGLPRGAPERAE